MAKASAKGAKTTAPTIAKTHITSQEAQLTRDLYTQGLATSKEDIKMSRGPRTPTNAKTVYVKFDRPDDLDLYERLKADAESKRYDLSTYILLVLLEAYPEPAEEINMELKAASGE